VKALGRAAASYAALALAATWPLVLHLGTHVPGAEDGRGFWLFSEAEVNLWNLWWFRHSLVDLRQSPFHCQLLFHPFGANLWLHMLAPLHGAIALLLQGVFSLAAAQNLLILGNLVGAALCMRALALRLGVAEPGALLAGAIYAFSPPAFAHLYAGHYEIVSTLWLPAALLLFLRLLDRPSLSRGIVLGLLLAACAYAVQYYAIYAAELLVVAALVHWRRVARADALRALAAGALAAGSGMAPMILQILAGENQTAPNTFDFDWFSGDLLSYVLPSFTHPLLSEPLAPFYRRLNPGELPTPQETTMFVGLSVLVLAALGWRTLRRERRPVALLSAMLGVFFVLSLGSHLKAFGINTGVSLPAALLADIPVLRMARSPGRHVVLVVLALAVLTGTGYDALRRRWLRLVLPLVVAFEYAAVPLPLLSTAAAPVYRRLAQVPGDYAVIELPLEVRDGQLLLGKRNPGQALGQIVHGHPIVGGMVSRLPVETLRAIVAAPVVGTLLNRVGATSEAIVRDQHDGPGWFARNRIRAIVIHAPFVGSPQHRYLERVLTVASRESLADGTQLLWLADVPSSASAASSSASRTIGRESPRSTRCGYITRRLDAISIMSFQELRSTLANRPTTQ
jgi:hypothetical protein